MGVINVTPDSFSGDGLDKHVDFAVARARKLQFEGADVLDIGGESTRPGHRRIESHEELERVVPAVRAIVQNTSIPVSVDTSRAIVAEQALDAGARIVNDVSGLSDPDMAPCVARYGCGLVCVHPGPYEADVDLVGQVIAGLDRLAQKAISAGVSRNAIILDPGLGFGFGWKGNFEVLRRLVELRVLGLPILIGASRKGMIGRVLGDPVHDRLEGSIALSTISVARGADAIRVHDVAAHVKAVRVIDAVRHAGA